MIIEVQEGSMWHLISNWILKQEATTIIIDLERPLQLALFKNPASTVNNSSLSFLYNIKFGPHCNLAFDSQF